MKTAERARGKWRGILLALGIEGKFLSGKHGPCPFCEGRDRFRWDNKDGGGSFYCSHCGAGDGIEFVKRARGCDFREAAKLIDEIVGGVGAEPSKPAPDARDRVAMLNRLWRSADRMSGADAACDYLAGRDVLPDAIPACLRFAERCPVPFGGGYAPAMLALVMGADGAAVQIHRTFLTTEGGKRNRAMMPGPLPQGSAVRLFPVHGARLGIAEGIETALAAAKRFAMPVWSALNSATLAGWIAPPGVEEVVVFGDNDPKFGGQGAAYALAHRLAARSNLRVEVRIPEIVGTDWADAEGDAQNSTEIA